jgi:hypothetical protein
MLRNLLYGWVYQTHDVMHSRNPRHSVFNSKGLTRYALKLFRDFGNFVFSTDGEAVRDTEAISHA